MQNSGKRQPIHVQGDGLAQVKEKIDSLIEYGYGTISVVVRDHEIINIDVTMKTVKAPSPPRDRT